MRMIVTRAGQAAALAMILAGCATTGPATPGDPLERMNRGTQKFNDAIDRAVLKPVAKGYRKAVPKPVRTGLGNLIRHLAFPTTIVNDLLQLKLKDTATDIGRFFINSTLGVGGLLDPASGIGMVRNEEDFGQTLGRWGLPAGPYLVLPLLGPSTLRDAPALAADAQTDLRAQLDVKTSERIAIGFVSAIDQREGLLNVDPTVDAAYDRYAFIRDAWLQRREYQVRDGDVPEELPLPEESDEADEPEVQEPDEVVADRSSETSLMPASAESAGGTLR